MRFNKMMLVLLSSVTLLWLTACVNGEKLQENPQGVEEGLSGVGAIQFTEFDRTGLESEKVVAVYEGGEITGAELADYITLFAFLNPSLDINDQEFRQELLKELIFAQEFRKQAEVTTEVQQQADELWEKLKMFYNEETRSEGYAKLGTSEEKVKESLLAYMATQATIQDFFRQQVSEAEIKARYEETEVQEQITIADVRHILIKTHDFKEDGTMEEVRADSEALELATDLYKQLQEGVDFAELATKHTEDEGSKANGGLYAGAPVGNWVPEFKEAAKEQEIGVIGEPVKTMYGYHLIRVEERKVMSFEDVREGILNELAGQKYFAYYEEKLPSLIKEINI